MVILDNNRLFVLTRSSLSTIDLRQTSAGAVSTTTVATTSAIAASSPPLPSECFSNLIELQSLSIVPSSIIVRAGDELVFRWVAGFHYLAHLPDPLTYESCNETGALFVSPASSQPGFEFRLSTAGLSPGIYRYACPIHCEQMQATFQIIEVKNFFLFIFFALSFYSVEGLLRVSSSNGTEHYYRFTS